MATETKPSAGRVKSSNQDGSSKGKVDSSSVNKKKIDGSAKPCSADSKQLKSASTLTKIEVKSKKTSSSSKTTMTTTTTTKVREKKVFTLAGQKFDPPEQREPLRIFYESLSKQIPTSEMAGFWMMEHGLLSPERAKKAYERKQRKQKQLRMGTPPKTPNLTTSKPESSQRQQQASKNDDGKAKKRIVKDSDDDNDFIFSPKRRKGRPEISRKVLLNN